MFKNLIEKNENFKSILLDPMSIKKGGEYIELLDHDSRGRMKICVKNNENFITMSYPGFFWKIYKNDVNYIIMKHGYCHFNFIDNYDNIMIKNTYIQLPYLDLDTDIEEFIFSLSLRNDFNSSGFTVKIIRDYVRNFIYLRELLNV